MSIHAKIQKLLNLAERAGTEAEAAAAMNAAHALLAKHNFSMAEVEAATTEKPEAVITDDSTQLLASQYRSNEIPFNPDIAIELHSETSESSTTRSFANWYVLPASLSAVIFRKTFV